MSSYFSFCWIYHYILFIKSPNVFIFFFLLNVSLYTLYKIAKCLHIFFISLSFCFFVLSVWYGQTLKQSNMKSLLSIVLRASHERLTLQRSCDMLISHLIDRITFFCIDITCIMSKRDHTNWVVFTIKDLLNQKNLATTDLCYFIDITSHFADSGEFSKSYLIL